jgi:hypothetical protein
LAQIIAVGAGEAAIQRLDARATWAPLALTKEQLKAEEVAVFGTEEIRLAAVFQVEGWQEVAVAGASLYVPRIASADLLLDAPPMPPWFWSAINREATGSRVALSCYEEAEGHTHPAEVLLAADVDPGALAAVVVKCAEGSKVNRARPDWPAAAAAVARCVHWCPYLADGQDCPDCPGPATFCALPTTCRIS